MYNTIKRPKACLLLLFRITESIEKQYPTYINKKQKIPIQMLGNFINNVPMLYINGPMFVCAISMH